MDAAKGVNYQLRNNVWGEYMFSELLNNHFRRTGVGRHPENLHCDRVNSLDPGLRRGDEEVRLGIGNQVNQRFLRNLLLLSSFVPLISLAQDQEMKVYASGDYANTPFLYISILTEEEVGDIIPLITAVTKFPITAIELESPQSSVNRVLVVTCSGYIMVSESRTCEGGGLYALQKNSSDEWEMAPELPVTWRY